MRRNKQFCLSTPCTHICSPNMLSWSLSYYEPAGSLRHKYFWICKCRYNSGRVKSCAMYACMYSTTCWYYAFMTFPYLPVHIWKCLVSLNPRFFTSCFGLGSQLQNGVKSNAWHSLGVSHRTHVDCLGLRLLTPIDSPTTTDWSFRYTNCTLCNFYYVHELMPSPLKPSWHAPKWKFGESFRRHVEVEPWNGEAPAWIENRENEKQPDITLYFVVIGPIVRFLALVWADKTNHKVGNYVDKASLYGTFQWSAFYKWFYFRIWLH